MNSEKNDLYVIWGTGYSLTIHINLNKINFYFKLKEVLIELTFKEKRFLEFIWIYI